jgi:hypothetical protein
MGRFGSFLYWYRLKSNDHHLFLKISGKDYIEEQPETIEGAVEYAQETVKGTAEIGEIIKQDNRILVLMLDVRDCDMSDMNFMTLFKYCSIAANQGYDIERFEVRGAGELWKYLTKFLPKYLKDRVILID